MKSLPRLSAKEAERRLLSADFRLVHQKGSHRIYRNGSFRMVLPWHGGKHYIWNSSGRRSRRGAPWIGVRSANSNIAFPRDPGCGRENQPAESSVQTGVTVLECKTAQSWQDKKRREKSPINLSRYNSRAYAAHTLLDVSSLTALGWVAPTGLREGLGAYYHWYLDHIGELRA